MFIKELHQLACAGQETYSVLVANLEGGFRKVERELTLGRYKDLPNNATRHDGSVHYYAPPIDVAPEMDDFVQALNSAAFKALDPIVQVAYSHYGLVHIHPFPDGNGRTARVLSSRYSFSAYGIPLLVFADRRETYLQSLEGVALSNLHEFVTHVTARLTDTLSHAVQQLQHLQAQPLEHHVESLTSYLSNYTNATVETLDAVGGRIVKKTAEIVESFAQKVRDQSNGAIEVTSHIPDLDSDHLMDLGYYLPNDQFSFHDYSSTGDAFNRGGPIAGSVRLRVARPVEAEKEFFVGVAVSSDPAIQFPFRIAANNSRSVGESGFVELRYEDCFPTLGANANDRLLMLIEAAFIDGVDRLNQEVDRIIGQAGGLKR